MKKIITVLIVCLLMVLAISSFTACTGEESSADVICTVFPLYDWTKNVAGDKVSVSVLLDSGADLHSYNPTVKDMYDIANCKLFIYVGGESDEWVDDVLTAYPNENRKVINLMEALGDKVREEEAVEGMQEEEHEEGEEEEEYDEHIWLSLKNAAACCDAIAQKLVEIDADNAETYRSNLTSYKEKLNALDARYAEATSSATVKTLVFADRFPFLYMMKDYGISYYAAFQGCSTEVNAAPSTIKFLADKVSENNLKTIIAIDGSDQKIAQAVKRETATKDQSILVLHSLQSIGKTEIDKGTTYLSVMESNLATLKEALK